MQPIDYGSVIRSSKAIMPDFAAQELQKRVLALQEGQARQQQEAFNYKMAEAQRVQAKQQAFQTDIETAVASGDPAAIAGMMAKYPEMSEGLKRSWDAMDEGKRNSDLRSMATIFSAGQSGNFELAANNLRERIRADEEAGDKDPNDAAMLALLESKDPIKQKQAMGMIGVQLAAVTGDKFASTYGEIVGSPTTLQREAEYYRSIGRDDLAEQMLTNKADPLTMFSNSAGTTIMPRSQLTGQPAPRQSVAPQSGDTGGRKASYATPEQVATLKESMGEQAAMQYLQSRGIDAVEAIRDVDGRQYFQINGQWFENTEAQ